MRSTEVKTRNVPPDIAKARSELANAAKSGDPAAITAARKTLASIKIERLEADMIELRRIAEGGLPDPGRLLLTHVSKDERVLTAQQHWELQCREADQLRAFVREHSPVEDWNKSTHAEYRAILDQHTAVHRAIGCSQNAPCLSARHDSRIVAG